MTPKAITPNNYYIRKRRKFRVVNFVPVKILWWAFLLIDHVRSQDIHDHLLYLCCNEGLPCL